MLLKKIITTVAIGTLAVGGLLAAGCTALGPQDRPYSLTGTQSSIYGVNGAAASSPLTAAEVARYTDQKNRFHPEWVGKPGR
jgi:hypothetical protein